MALGFHRWDGRVAPGLRAMSGRCSGASSHARVGHVGHLPLLYHRLEPQAVRMIPLAGEPDSRIAEELISCFLGHLCFVFYSSPL